MRTSISSKVSESSKNLIHALASEETMDRFTPATYALLAEGVKELVMSEAKDGSFFGVMAYHHLIPKSNDVESSLTQARAQYQAIKEGYEFGSKVLAANNNLVNTVLRAGAAVATASGVGMLQGLALGAMTEVSSIGLSQVLTMYDGSAMEAAQRFVSLKLRELPESAWREWDGLSAHSPDQARAFVAKRIHDWSRAVGADGSDEEAQLTRSVFESYLIRATTAQLAKERSLRELADLQLSEQIRANHAEVLDKLDRMHTDLLLNREMVRLVATKSVLMCSNFLSSREESDHFDSGLGQFMSYSGLRNHFNEYSREFFSCVDGLEELIGNVDFSRVFLSSEAFKKQGNGIDIYINKMYRPTLAYWRERLGKDSSSSVSLNFPSAQTAGVAIKYQELRKNEATPAFDVDLLDEPIAVDALEKYIGYLVEVSPYFDLVSYERGGGLDDVQEILVRGGNGFRRKKALLLLKRALSLTQLAIAQETLISGDKLLESLYNEAFEPREVDCIDPKSRPKAVCVLQENPLLARNFVHYGLGRDLRENGNNLIAYDVAKGSEGDSRLLQEVISRPWRYTWENNRWGVRFGNRVVPLPTSHQLLEDRMEYRSEMGRLLRLREQISGILTEAELGSNLEASGKRDLFYLLLKAL